MTVYTVNASAFYIPGAMGQIWTIRYNMSKNSIYNLNTFALVHNLNVCDLLEITLR